MSGAFPEQARVGLVTGAAGGIGEAICRRLASELPALALAYGQSAPAAEALAEELAAGPAEARAFGADMADPDAPDALVEAVEASLGPVDVLVVNHGYARRRSFEEVDADAFDLTLAINLRAPFLLARRVLPGMIERGFGRILLVSSTAAFRGGVITPPRSRACTG